jgi:hypothetical protein
MHEGVLYAYTVGLLMLCRLLFHPLMAVAHLPISFARAAENMMRRKYHFNVRKNFRVQFGDGKMSNARDAHPLAPQMNCSSICLTVNLSSPFSH